MSFWTAVVIIVAIGALSEIYRARLKAQSKRSEAVYDELAARMSRLEERVANVETILVDREKAKPFAQIRSEL